MIKKPMCDSRFLICGPAPVDEFRVIARGRTRGYRRGVVVQDDAGRRHGRGGGGGAGARCVRRSATQTYGFTPRPHLHTFVQCTGYPVFDVIPHRVGITA